MKFILSDFKSDYKSRLSALNLLPLMMSYELNYLLFFVKAVKDTDKEVFNIENNVSFATGVTRSAATMKLKRYRSGSASTDHLHFRRLPHCRINSLPLTLAHPSTKNKVITLKSILWSHFGTHFDSSDPCSFHFLCPCFKCSNISKPSNFFS